MRGPETRLRKKIEHALKEKFPEGVFLKIHGNQYQNVGILDLICCVRGRFIALEIKTERGKTTLVQEIMLKRIRKAQGGAYVIRSVSDALAAVSDALKAA